MVACRFVAGRTARVRSVVVGCLGHILTTAVDLNLILEGLVRGALLPL